MSDDPVRVGVDVGGTFTKAVAVDATGVVAEATVPTTHGDPGGVAAGVVAVVDRVHRLLGDRPITLVTHSTTQAVNALLEGDVGTVGVIGMGRRPDLRKASKRTRLDAIDTSPGRRLATVSAFLDVTDGVDPAELDAALDRFIEHGVTAVCVAEAFATEDNAHERQVVEAATARGLPACASTDMSGLYGLELRAVTAAINASILPIALSTAAFVADGVAEVGIDAPVMVMRGDGGATDLDGFRREPARTLYSGPAASVAGVLRHTKVVDGIVVEIGGTSTNIAAIKNGRPELSYVRVASHATALRAIDVRVIGVAGGSMLRSRRSKVHGVGPRSAHIAGLRYSCFADAGEIEGGSAVLFAPRPDDPADYLAIEAPSGVRFALTNTCAANLLGIVHEGDYAKGDAVAARTAFAIAGVYLRLPADEVARRMLEASGHAVAEIVATVMRDHHLVAPTLVAVGGGAGGLGRHVAAMLRLECSVPDGAAVISSIGDALSLVRAERERTVTAPTATDITALVDETREEAVSAGASPASVDVRVDHVPERSALRAVAIGAVALQSGAMPGRNPIDADQATELVRSLGLDRYASRFGSYWYATTSTPATGADDTRMVVLDRFGDPALDAKGLVIETGHDLQEQSAEHEAIAKAVHDHTRHMGPVSIAPTVWVLGERQLIELSDGDVGRIATEMTNGTRSLVIVTKGS